MTATDIKNSIVENICGVELFGNCPIPVKIVADDTTILWINKAFALRTGFSPSEVVGIKVPYPWFTSADDSHLSPREIAISENQWGSQRFASKNGTEFWVEYTTREIPMANSKRKIYLIYWIDVTERDILRRNTIYYIKQITRTQEAERKRIARDIHDGAVQSLASLALYVDSLTKKRGYFTNDTVKSSVREIREKINAIMADMRLIIDGLRPCVIDHVGLLAALESLVEESHKININVRICAYGKVRRLPAETELMLFRIVQEALSNVRRHANAKNAKINIRYYDDMIRLSIIDNGKGFVLPERLTDHAVDGRMGIISMQERARLLDGLLTVKSRPGTGTLIQVTCPIFDQPDFPELT